MNPDIGCRIERIRPAIHSREYAFSRDVLTLLGSCSRTQSLLLEAQAGEMLMPGIRWFCTATHIGTGPLWIKSVEENSEGP